MKYMLLTYMNEDAWAKLGPAEQQRLMAHCWPHVEKLRAQNVAFEELIMPDEIHDLLRWNDWVRAYRATADFFDRKLAASGKPQ